MKNKMWIEKNSVRKAIDKNEYEQYKQSGWINAKDKYELNVKTMKRRWINNGSSNKWVKSDEYNTHLNSGWSAGRISVES